MDFEAIRNAVIKTGGVKYLQMKALREASGFNRLGSGVNEEISASLRQKSLGHTPDPLPINGSASVYVFDLGSDAGRLIQAVAGGSPSEDGAKTILDAARPETIADSAEAKLEAIRRLSVELNDILREGEGEGEDEDEDGLAEAA